MIVMLAILVVLAIAAPLFGANSRDGLDWAKNHFWQPRNVKTADSPAPAAVARDAVVRHRTAPAAW